MKKILFFTGSRAEYGLLKNLICKFQSDPDYNTHVAVTGTHLSANHGMTIGTIQADNIKNIHPIDLKISDDQSITIANSIGIGIIEFSKLLNFLKPDLLILLGDRYELWTVTIPAVIGNIPIAHIHGGEITKGVIDDVVRHSVTKMSHMHFCSNEEYRERIIRMGEDPSKVWTVGAPGLDRIREMNFYTREEIELKAQIKFNLLNVLCTFHPVTLNEAQSAQEIDSLINVIEIYVKNRKINFFISFPNSDVFSSYIKESWEKLIFKYPQNIFGSANLGDHLYLSLMNEVDVVLGNSSSGIVEAPFLKKAVIDLGGRQTGRLRSNHILHSENGKDLAFILEKALSPEFQEYVKSQNSIYGDGNTNERIYSIIKNEEIDHLIFKKFHNDNL